MTEKRQDTVQRMVQGVGVCLSKLYKKVLLIVVVQRETPEVSKHTPVIYVANHPNTLDPFYLLGILPERVVILITEHVFNIPFVGKLVRRAGHIQVPPQGGGVYEQAKQMLLRGTSLLLFSEGEISYSPNHVRKFHTGAVRLSLETGAPIVPIGIHLDATKIWKRKTEINHASLVFTWYRYGWYTVVFGKSFSVSGDIRKRGSVRKNTATLRRHVLSCMHQAECLGAQEAALPTRKAKQGFHSVLRGVYRCACFVAFIVFKLNEVGVKLLG